VQAIYAEAEVPAESKSYVEINALWFKDRDAARRAIDEAAG
jgi:hypothetical protein